MRNAPLLAKRWCGIAPRQRTLIYQLASRYLKNRMGVMREYGAHGFDKRQNASADRRFRRCKASWDLWFDG